jgi:murein DD-endopeptidase MepM/ murein hydrolase activator NlpD
MSNKKLQILVPKICSGDYNQSELMHFVNLVQKISLSYLKYQEVIGKHIRWERRQRSNELDDMAIDCVAGLFMRNEKDEFVQLKRYFEPHLEKTPEPDEVELLVLLRRLVIKKTKQELSRIFKERDPEGAKIIRNIRVAVKNADDLSTFREMGREYIFFRPNTTQTQPEPDCPVETVEITEEINTEYLRKDKPTIPEKSLRSQYLDHYHPKDHVSTSIRKMLTVVSEEENFQNCIPTDVVARLIRNTNLEVVRSRLLAQIEEISPLDYVRMQEIDQAKNKVLKKIKAKIQNQYVASNKILPEKGDIYYHTLADVLDDITHSKKIESYFRHLKKYLPGLTQKKYRREERTIFEYLGKLTKKWFREYLKDLL